jgi:YD repeat-containing protein
VIDANGNRAEMSYDGFDRLRRWTFPSNAPGNANPADYEEYDYDLVGNRTKLRKRDGSELGYQYDNLDRVIRKVVPERPGLDPVHTRDVFYAYDHALGLQTHARFDSLDGEGVATWYDAFGQPTTVLLNMGGVGRYVSYYHDDAGNLRSLGHPDGAAFVSDHDSLGRVTATFEHRSPASMDDYLIRYWYNPAGNRLSAVRGANSGGFYTVWYRDGLERPTTLANDLPGTANDAPVELAWNAAGQIVDLAAEQGPTSGTVTDPTARPAEPPPPHIG